MSGTHSAAPDSTALNRHQWSTLGIFGLLAFACAVDRFILGAVLTPLKADLALTDQHVARAGMAFTLAYLLIVPILGFLGDHVKRKPLILGGLVLWSIASIGGGFATGIVSLLVWRAAVGGGEGAYQSVAPSWLADVFAPNQRGRIFAVYSGVSILGYTVSYVVGGWLAAQYGWRVAFYISGLPGLLLAVAVLLLKEPSRGQSEGRAEPPPRPTLREAAALLREPLFLIFVLGNTIQLYALGGVSFWGPALLHRVYGLSNQEGTAFFGLAFGLAGVAGTLTGGFVAGALRRRFAGAYAAWSALVAAACVATVIPALLAGDARTAEIWFFVEIFFSTAGLGVSTPLLLELVPLQLRATAQSLVISISMVGSTLLQTEVMGYLSDRYGLATAMFLVPAFFTFSVGLWLVLAVRQRRLAEFAPVSR